jgi:hypothetical protein
MSSGFKRRVLDEKVDLDVKLEKLCFFTRGDIFPTLPVMEQERLNMQKHLMLAYSAVLGERIRAFNDAL